MSTTTALFKKELHTAKWFLLGGVLFFWSFPLMEGTGTYLRSGAFRTDMPSGMALGLGGLFAIITACGMVCMDMPKGLYEFWRSRPVKLLPYMIIKYGIGLAVTLFVINAPLLLEIYLFRKADVDSFQGGILYCHTFIIILLYSVAFCAGHIFRNMTEAMIISCAAALLVYFVPVLVPAMEPVSFFNILNSGPGSFRPPLLFNIFEEVWLFMVTAITLSAVMFSAAWVCLKYHFQVRLGMKSLCWSLGLVALILFSAAAFSVASNLNCLAKISLSVGAGESIALSSCFDGKSGVVLCDRYYSDSRDYDTHQIDRINEGPSYTYRHELYPFERSLPFHDLFHGSCRITWSKQAPDIVYLLEMNEPARGNGNPWRFTLYVIRLDESTHTARILSELPMGEYDAKKMTYRSGDLVLDRRTLYLLLPGEVAIVDVNDDKQPRLLTKSAYQALYQGKENEIIIPLPTDNALSEEQRYRIVQYFARKSGDWEGDRYVRAENNLVCVYEVKEIGSKEIRLAKIADRKYLPLEKLMYGSSGKVILHGDIIYLHSGDSSLTVYELNESLGTLKNIGHYAAPEGGFYDMFLREDGLITLVGNKQIHIIQPPAVKSR